MTERQSSLRIGITLAGLVGLTASCGEAPGEAGANAAEASEVTVVLPPPAPPLDAEASPPPASGSVTGQQAAWAGVLRRVGFPCERITSVIENGGGYRVDCEGGGPYRATRRDGRIKFSRWRSA